MDVFQVLTLCSLLGVMFIGVLGYGMYRNWQRNQLELISAPSVDPDVSGINDSTQRIYPNIRVSSKPKLKTAKTPVAIVDGTQPPIGKPKEIKSDPKRIESGRSAHVAGTKKPLSKPQQPDLDTTNAKGSPQQQNGKSQSEVNSEHVAETSDSPQVSDSTQVTDDGLDAFRSRADRAEEKNGKQNSKPTFLRVKTSSRLERKPPQASKRRKSKAVANSNNGARDSASSGNSGEDFVMFFVLGDHNNSFRMNEVGQFLLTRGLALDELGLFCRKDGDSGEVLFKVGDVFFPGTFEADELEQYRTGGISLAMKIPNVNNAQVVFEQMLSLANECAERFQGTVKDENYNSMSNQTLAHYRNRVSDFRRKQLTMYA
ncbi:MAG: hypothetical protein F4X44_06380 [Gammaproteobacteria bacterium]|nr:hypothetical protein [Gammaproteobacteria bacterium]MYD80219.1 hypothetical protein [Gammaproteobacteria bacterium]